MDWDGNERRERSDFEREQIEFMAEMREHMRGQAKRLDSHAIDITTLDARQTIVEQAVEIGLDREPIGRRVTALEASWEAIAKIGSISAATIGVLAAAFELWRYAHP